ncbi:MAG: hypothetical protein H7329_19405 [Opitutaceae bacterium]|nr:hypothetical protein [Cytophagales bacterium]
MKIVIGSVLKPLTDVRHYYKIALSLTKLPNAKITILARQVQDAPTNPAIELKSITPAQYSLIQRFLATYLFIGRLFRIRPNIIIVCTHELLIAAIIYKSIFGGKLIYDIQENYALNIVSNKTYSSYFKFFLSKYIRLKEDLCSKFVDRFWLAESCYQHELKFLHGNFDVFENKSMIERDIKPVSFQDQSKIKLIFSGTIAEENGIFEAINLTKQLYDINPDYSLLITGCCHNTVLFKKIKELTERCTFILINISTEPIDYQIIKEEIRNADIGLICYQTQANFINKIPTKLYEYLSVGLPILLTTNTSWTELCCRYNASIELDFKQYDPIEIDRIIRSVLFYNLENINNAELLWSKYENQLLHSLKNIA